MKKAICILLSSIFLIESLCLNCFASSSSSGSVTLSGSDLYYYLSSSPSSYLISGKNNSLVRGVMDTKLVDVSTSYADFLNGSVTSSPLIYSDQYFSPDSSSFTFNLPGSNDCYSFQASLMNSFDVTPYHFYDFPDYGELGILDSDGYYFTPPWYLNLTYELAVYNDGKFLTTLQASNRPSGTSYFYISAMRSSMYYFDASSFGTFIPLENRLDFPIPSELQEEYNQMKNVASPYFEGLIINLTASDFGLEKFGEVSFTLRAVNYTYHSTYPSYFGFMDGFSAPHTQIDNNKILVPVFNFFRLMYNVAPSDTEIFSQKLDDIIDNQKKSLENQAEIKESIYGIKDSLENPSPERQEEASKREEQVTSMLSDLDELQSQLEVEKPELTDDYDFTDQPWWSDSVDDVKSIFDLFTDHFSWLTSILVAVAGLVIIRLILYGTNG